MAKKSNKKRKNNKKISDKNRLKQETIQSIWGIIFLSISIILTLAGFGGAGAIGETIYNALFWLFGWGYVFLPITFIGGAINFFINKVRSRIYSSTFIGSIIFLFSALGFMDVLSPSSGGVIGDIFGYPTTWFGNLAWGIVTILLGIIGIIVTLDQPIYLRREPRENKEEIKEIKKERKESVIPSIPEIEKDIEKIEKESKKEMKETKKEKEEKDEEEYEKMYNERTYSQALDKEYSAPPYNLLKSKVEKPKAGDLRASANIIKRTLESFGIPVEIGEINIGPKVTRYALRPAEGIKLSRIIALNQDLSLALSAHPIRIEAPIPGKPYVGIEVPNKDASIVRLGELISYPEFKNSPPLTIPLGKDVTGKPIFADIASMPHLLVAGATGAGKSITLHSLLISLLYKNSPANLNLVMIDPKRVELSHYSGLPHLTAPVVTSGKKSLGVFRWAISEMDRRYDLLLSAGARDIQSYNKKNGNIMPYIIIVVDEMADLMATYGHDIENAIVRLAQMARATGIHLILSTQRPSVEVITGLIKANITSRIALQVASQIDSRTILDTSGAEKLLGGGDFLFTSAKLSKPKRIQGAYISEEEIKDVASYIKKNNKNYVNEINIDGSEEVEDGSNLGPDNLFESFEVEDEEDDLIPEAIELIKIQQKASSSLLQRKLKVGYARAARILDILEDKGVVGPSNGAKPREVYINEEGKDNLEEE